VSLARDVTERIQSIRELQVLSIASEQLSSSLVRGQVLRALTTAAADMCSGAGEESRRAQLFVIAGPMIVMTGAHDPAGPVKTEGVRLPIAEHPYIQRVIATGEAVVAPLNYTDFGPTVAEGMRLSEVRNCVWIPLKRNNRVYAVLAVAGRQHALIQSAQLERLKTLAAIGELALSNAEAHELVADMARTDPLTGVGNRRALEDQFRRMPRSRFALLAMDVDGLKKVNDAHGHDAGDILLSGLAAALAAELRPADLLARTGGDEFMAVLVDCDARGAIDLGGRLQRAAANVKFPWGAGSISVGSAAGVAGERPEAVAKAADLVLYEAKQVAGTRR
jgi:diguanylate cyclase (GGDEF)-like protein